jgi:hypothetical protein
VFVNRVLRNKNGPMRQEVTASRRKLHNTYSSPNIRMIKSRKIGGVRHIACMGDEKYNNT